MLSMVFLYIFLKAPLHALFYAASSLMIFARRFDWFILVVSFKRLTWQIQEN